MIVNIDISDNYINPLKPKSLVLSYVNSDKEISYMKYDIPKEKLFNWRYADAKTISMKDQDFVSWDNKYVVRDYIDFSSRKTRFNDISNSRTREIIMELMAIEPRVSVINELNMPNTAFCDIEVQVSKDGFPEAHTALNRVNTISWVYGSDVHVLGLADLSGIQIKSIQKRMDEHCKNFDTRYMFTYHYYETEEDMLMDFFISYISQVPCITGWNFLGYDYMYFYNRVDVLSTRLTPSRKKELFEKYILPYLKTTVDPCTFTSKTVFNKGKINKYIDVSDPYMQKQDALYIARSFMAPENTWFEYSLQTKKGKKKKSPNTDEEGPQEEDNKAKQKVMLPKHRMIYDYMEIYVKWDKVVDPKEINKLDWVSNKVLGTKKVVHSLGFEEMWEQDPEGYVFYNGIDSVLVKEIDNKIKTSSAFFGLANLMHVPALTAFSPVQSIQIVQTEYLYKEGKVFPPKQKKFDEEEDDEGYEGAFVFEPVPGIYKNIIALDFASLYPSTIRQFNISPETFLGKDKNHVRKDDEIMTTSGAVYKRNEEGFIPKILTDFYKQRKAYKKDMLVAEKETETLREIYEKRFGAVK